MVSQSGVIAGHAYVLIEAVDKTGKILNQVSRKLNRLGDQVISLGLRLAALGATLGVPFVQSVKASASYTDSLMALKAVLNVTDAQLKSTSQLIRHLGRTTSFTADQIAEASVELGRGGFSQKQIEDSLQSVLNFARAGRVDLTTAARIMVQSMTTFGIAAKNSSEIADKFFVAATKGVADATELAEAFVYVGQSASGLGMSIDETLAVLAVMSNSMLSGSIGGTSFNNALVNITKNSEKFQEQFGFSPIDQFTGELLPLQTIMLGISNTLSKMGSGQAKKAIQEALNIRGARAVEAMVRQITRIPVILEAIRNSSNESARASKIMDSEIGGSIRIINSAFNDLKIVVGRGLSPIFLTLRKRLVPIVNGVSIWAEKNGELIRKTALWVTGLLGAGVALVALGVQIKFVAFSLSTITAAFKFLKSILYLIVLPLQTIIILLSKLAVTIDILINSAIIPLIRSLILIPAKAIWAATTMTASFVAFTAKSTAAMAVFTAKTLSMLTVITAQVAAMTVYLAAQFAALAAMATISLTITLASIGAELASITAEVIAGFGSIGFALIGMMISTSARITALTSLAIAKVTAMVAAQMATFALSMAGTILTVLGPIALLIAGIMILMPITDWILATTKKLVASVTGTGKAVLDWFVGIGKSIKNLFSRASSSASSIFLSLQRTIVSWAGSIVAYLSSVPGVVMEVFGDISSWFKKRFSEMGKYVNIVINAIKDRLKAGDVESAMNLLVTGLKYVWNEGLINIKEAWLNLTYAIEEAWIGLSATVKTIWRNTQNDIAKMILDWAAGNKVANWFMKLVSGVDIQEEIKRNAALNSQLGVSGGGLAGAKAGLDEETKRDIEAIQSNAGRDRANLVKERAKLLEQYRKDRAKARAGLETSVGKIMKEANDAAKKKDVNKSESEAVAEKLARALGAGMGAGRRASLPGVAMKYTAEAAKQAYRNQWQNQTLNALNGINSGVAQQNELTKKLIENTVAVGIVGGLTAGGI